MFKEHPRGLIIAFFTNMGERFGFYTMMAILTLFLQVKYGLTNSKAGLIYSIFYACIYGLALVGGIIADYTKNYKGTIRTGIILMFLGYALMAVPGFGLPMSLLGLATIAFGNGLFKGNLQAVVGQMYDDPKYSNLRDRAFSIFYMGINIGAFFAPDVANGVRNWYLKLKGFGHDADLPGLCHQLLDGTLTDTTTMSALAQKVSGGTVVTDLNAFATKYINVFSTGYNMAFGVAGLAMVVSFVVYLIFGKKLPDVREKVKAAGKKIQEMPWAVEKKRLFALGLVFMVVIFFWMSFHQNGLTLTFFARDYTVKSVGDVTNMFFNVWSFLSIIAVILGFVFVFNKKANSTLRTAGTAMILVGGYLCYHFYNSFSGDNPIAPEVFQKFNPFFIVFLTPVVVGFFAWLDRKGRDPSTPKKIGIGMVIAACGYVVMILSSLDLTSPSELAGQPSPERVSTYWLIGNYFILTIAELFLSPMGISFVSKVSPPRFQGLMQGCWLGATALGNQLLFVGSNLYDSVELWMVWGFFVICCLASAAFIFFVMKRLEQAANS